VTIFSKELVKKLKTVVLNINYCSYIKIIIIIIINKRNKKKIGVIPNQKKPQTNPVILILEASVWNRVLLFNRSHANTCTKVNK
jgi:hypothetical protein